MLDELAPQALHRLEQYATTESKPTTGQLKRRLRPMRGLMTDRLLDLLVRAVAR